MSRIRYSNIAASEKNKIVYTTQWLSISLVVASIACLIAAGVTLKAVDGRPLSHWYSSPAVILAVISSVFNVCLGCLASLGVATLWWRAAARGSTLKGLHLIWNRGQGLTFFSSLVGGPHSRRAAVAATVIAISRFSNGPMLQRASQQAGQEVVHLIPIKLQAVNTLPLGFFSRRGSNLLTPGSIELLSSGARLFRIWQEDGIELMYNGVGSRSEWRKMCPYDSTNTCDGFACPRNSTCFTKVKGPGITYDCSKEVRHAYLRDPSNINRTVFSINFTMAGTEEDPILRVDALYNNHTYANCTGQMVLASCDIRAAISEYDVTLKWSDLTLRNSLQPDDEPVFISNLTSPGDSPRQVGTPDELGRTWSGPLVTLYQILGEYYTTFAIIQSPVGISSDRMTNLFWDPTKAENATLCTNTFQEPIGAILKSAWRLLFLASHYAAAWNGTYQTVTANEYRPTIIHRLDTRYLGAALAVMTTGLISAVVLLWGWWELDRASSLSPLETAAAFEAPLLGEDGVGRDVDGVLKLCWQKMVKYDGKFFQRFDTSELEERGQSAMGNEGQETASRSWEQSP